MPENKVLRTYDTEKMETRKLHTEVLCNLYSSPVMCVCSVNMGKTYSMHERYEVQMQNFKFENFKGKKQMGDLGMLERKILKWVLETQDVRM